MNDTVIVVKSLRDLIASQSELIRDAERRRQETHAELVRVGTVLCRDRLDDMKRTLPGEPQQWDSKLVADLIIEGVGRNLDAVELGLSDEAALAKIADLTQQLEQLQKAPAVPDTNWEQQVSELKTRNHVLEQENTDLRERLSRAEWPLPGQATQGTLDLEEDKEADSPGEAMPETQAATFQAGALVPEWIQRWQESPSYERDVALLKYMGDTGEFRKNKLRAHLTEVLNIGSGAALTRIFSALVDMDVIVIKKARIKSVSGAPGQPPAVVVLTEKGRDGYLALFGKQPCRIFEALLSKHKSPEHLYLNIEAADMLEAAGYVVDRLPPATTLPDDSKFMPDLIANAADGSTLYIECELASRKHPEQRQHKWDISRRATNGRLYIITPDRDAMFTIRGEILYYFKNATPRPALWITNIAEVRIGKRSQRDGSIWIVQQQ